MKLSTEPMILTNISTFPKSQLLRLKKLGFQVVFQSELTEQQTQKALARAKVYIPGAQKVTREFIQSAPNLRMVCFFGVGFQPFIDASAAAELGVVVTNAPGCNAQAVAEFTIGLMLDAVKKITVMATEVSAGFWQPRKTFNVSGKTLGIVGLGNIGGLVARMAHYGLGMHILYSGRTAKLELEQGLNARMVDLSKLLQGSDVVTLHCSTTPETIGLIGEKELHLMREHAILLNLTRPEVVQPRPLYEALIAGSRPARAVFDGFYSEPASQCTTIDQRLLLNLPAEKFMLTPHAAWMTEETIEITAMMVTDSIQDLVNGRPIRHQVNHPVPLLA
jgi:gluconate 2-dehydrogenase